MKQTIKSGNEEFVTYTPGGYEWVQIKADGTLTALAIGDHYAGCACRYDNRPERCGKETITDCIKVTLRKLPEKERVELIEKLEEKYGKDNKNRIFGKLQ